MSINRNNYEEFFILYMDNELGIEERRLVEEFVAKNPDLKDEFDLFMQYKLAPDAAIQFENKSQLIKTEEYSPVNLANYPEWLVLYMDNELAADQQKAVEQFISEYPSAKLDLDLLMQTRMQPEIVVFPGKQSLYRREVRSVSMRWWRIAAAAVLIIAVSTTAVVTLNKKPISENGGLAGLLINLKQTNESAVVSNKDKVAPVTQPIVNNKQDINSISKPIIHPGNVAVKKYKNNVNELKQPKKDEPVFVDNNQKPSNNLPQPLNNPALNNNNTITKKDIPYNKPTLENQEVVKSNGAVTTNSPQTSDIKHASINSNDDVVFDQSDGKRSKLRGLLRKVTRTFEKTTNTTVTDNEDRVLIGGLALKLK